MNRPWVRIVLAIALLFAMSGGSAQHEALAAPDIVGAVIHFVPFSYTPSEVVIQPGESVEWDGDFSCIRWSAMTGCGPHKRLARSSSTPSP